MDIQAAQLLVRILQYVMFAVSPMVILQIMSGVISLVQRMQFVPFAAQQAMRL